MHLWHLQPVDFVPQNLKQLAFSGLPWNDDRASIASLYSRRTLING
jgi:hypothetical protein